MSKQPASKASKLADALRGIGQVSASVVGLLPGIIFFTSLKPPLFGALPLLTSGVAVAVLANAYFGSRRRNLLRRACYLVVGALVGATVYGWAFEATTVGVPTEFGAKGGNYQIGFGLANFSLTDEAIIRRDALRLRTPQDLMLAMGGYSEAGRQKIWRQWSILAAGMLLMVVYVTTFVVWAHAIGLLARALVRSPK